MSSSDESKTEKDERKEEKSDITTKVHSANCWEKADLGDDDRRQKFLRLMGASKKEHHGRFVIGDNDQSGNHSRDKVKTDELNKDLENQFVYSQEHKITKWSHTGLGFEKKEEIDKTQEIKKDTDPKETSGDGDEPEKTSGDGDKAEVARKRESTEPDKEEQIPTKKPKMMMAFVKASDS